MPYIPPLPDYDKFPPEMRRRMMERDRERLRRYAKEYGDMARGWIWVAVVPLCWIAYLVSRLVLMWR